MLYRCNDPSNKSYPRYGGAGITVCDRWHDFEAFLADMGERPEGTTIDRIEGAKVYAPGNCKWSTMKQQQRNRSSNKLVEYQGETLCVSDLAERVGLAPRKVIQRLWRGWSVEDAIR